MSLEAESKLIPKSKVKFVVHPSEGRTTVFPGAVILLENVSTPLPFDSAQDGYYCHPTCKAEWRFQNLSSALHHVKTSTSLSHCSHHPSLDQPVSHRLILMALDSFDCMLFPDLLRELKKYFKSIHFFHLLSFYICTC